ncbi:MAG: ribonuclease HI family protein [Candidatus Andersenbacteria bacterium]|nr:ribonuclease HI family protein [Candidatus Andersenbacteria bacterium]
MKATLHTDGGARGNPGPAGIGYVLVVEDKASIFHAGYIGETTNNQAEYQALVAGMKRALKEGVQELACYLDSELVVKQVRGEYRVKNMDLKPWVDEVQALRRQIAKVSFTHVRREKNKAADRLVNEAIDGHLN